MAKTAYGASGQPNAGQLAHIGQHMAQFRNTGVASQTAPAPGTAPGQVALQGGIPQQHFAQQVPQVAQQVPQVAQQVQQHFQRQAQQPLAIPQVPAQPQQQPQVPQHPAQQQAQDQANLVQSMIATQQAELTTLKAQVAAFEAAKDSRSAQDRIAERIGRDAFLLDEDNIDPEARAARVAQISFEELMQRNETEQRIAQTPTQSVDPILQELILERKVQGDLGLSLSAPQVQKVAEVASQIGGDTQRALAIASIENPALFGGNAGFQDGPGGQAMVVPQGGASLDRQQPTRESTYVQRLTDAREGGRQGVDGFVRGELLGRLGQHFPGLAQG